MGCVWYRYRCYAPTCARARLRLRHGEVDDACLGLAQEGVDHAARARYGDAVYGAYVLVLDFHHDVRPGLPRPGRGVTLSEAPFLASELSQLADDGLADSLRVALPGERPFRSHYLVGSPTALRERPQGLELIALELCGGRGRDGDGVGVVDLFPLHLFVDILRRAVCVRITWGALRAPCTYR